MLLLWFGAWVLGLGRVRVMDSLTPMTRDLGSSKDFCYRPCSEYSHFCHCCRLLMTRLDGFVGQTGSAPLGSQSLTLG